MFPILRYHLQSCLLHIMCRVLVYSTPIAVYTCFGGCIKLIFTQRSGIHVVILMPPIYYPPLHTVRAPAFKFSSCCQHFEWRSAIPYEPNTGEMHASLQWIQPETCACKGRHVYVGNFSNIDTTQKCQKALVIGTEKETQ